MRCLRRLMILNNSWPQGVLVGELPPLFRLGQVLVRAVAERRVRGVFALAPPDGFFLGDLVFQRLQAGAFMGSIAKRRVP